MRETITDRMDSSVIVIPRAEQYEEQPDSHKRVAPYCRVSTLQESQEDSYETQKAYYEKMIAERPNWDMVDMYADHGISATSMVHRDDFLRMIQDCKDGKIDMIVTKTVARFARNVVDCIATCRMLKNLDPPVSVYFEAQNLNTTAENSETVLSLLATLAQSESEAKSASIKWGIRRRFAMGIPKVVKLYGFDLNGKTLAFNEDIETVRLMYDLAERCTPLGEIRERLRLMGKPSPKGNEEWSVATIRYILSNEKYMGDILMQKTYVYDLMEHRSRKNTGQEPQYRLEGKLPPAVPKEQWLKVQRIIGNTVIDTKLFQDETVNIGPWSGLHTVIGR